MKRAIVLILVPSLVFVACGGGTSPDPCEGVTCSGHGTCGSISGEAACVCDEGYGGDQCGECGEGYHDEGGVCVVNEVCGADSCSGHGNCDDSTGVVACTCDEGHEGDRCETCSSGFQDNDGDGSCLPNCTTSGLDCGPHGTCDDTGGVAVCSCDMGYSGVLCDTCAAGYQDNDGNGTCLPDCDTSGLDCGLHGACDDSGGTAVCSCDVGYVGAVCEACAGGFQDNDGDGSCLPDCSTSGLDCGLHGACDDSSGSAVCTCDTGYAGTECDTCDVGYQDIDGSGTCVEDPCYGNEGEEGCACHADGTCNGELDCCGDVICAANCCCPDLELHISVVGVVNNISHQPIACDLAALAVLNALIGRIQDHEAETSSDVNGEFFFDCFDVASVSLGLLLLADDTGFDGSGGSFYPTVSAAAWWNTNNDKICVDDAAPFVVDSNMHAVLGQLPGMDPETYGYVIGMVLDANLMPLGGATVTKSDGTELDAIYYPNADFNDFSGQATDPAHGIFVIPGPLVFTSLIGVLDGYTWDPQMHKAGGIAGVAYFVAMVADP